DFPWPAERRPIASLRRSQRASLPGRATMPRYDDYEDYDDRGIDRGVPFPAGVMAAGIIWIAFGVLGITSSILGFVLNAGRAAPGQGPSSGAGGGCGLLVAIAFLVVGIQTVKGTAKGSLGNGIGSVVFGLLYGGLALLMIALASRPGTQLPPGLFYGVGGV